MEVDAGVDEVVVRGGGEAVQRLLRSRRARGHLREQRLHLLPVHGGEPRLPAVLLDPRALEVVTLTAGAAASALRHTAVVRDERARGSDVPLSPEEQEAVSRALRAGV